MGLVARPLAFYPGCSLESTAVMYHASVRATLQALGLSVPELADWNCCGATSAHFVDPVLAVTLPARNLALAEAAGMDLLTACAACHHRLVVADHSLRTSPVMAERARGAGVSYEGGVRVQHVLSLLDGAGLNEKVRNPLTGLRVACYYGCLLLRIPKVGGIDDPEDPTIMERVLRSCGAEVVSWQARTWCCGASLALPEPGIVKELIRPILDEAFSAGADCIATACPLCQLNLDLHQAADRAERDRAPLPVVFVTQLTALALGAGARSLMFDRHIVDAGRVAQAAAAPSKGEVSVP